jgi:hypothetical protein
MQVQNAVDIILFLKNCGKPQSTHYRDFSELSILRGGGEYFFLFSFALKLNIAEKISSVHTRLHRGTDVIC